MSEYLKQKTGFILVSHDRTFLDSCIDHILSINKTNIEIQKGNFSTWQTNKEYQDNFELAENEKLKKDINRLSESSKRTVNWSDSVESTKYSTRNSGLRPDRGYIGHKSAKMMKRAKSIANRRQKAIDEKSNLLKNLETSDTLSICPIEYKKNRLVEAIDLSISYEKRQVCEGISFTINRGERIALTGKNGCGKSSVLKLLMGDTISYKGTLNIGSNLKISYISQDTSFLKGTLTDFARESQIDESLFMTILRKMDFSRIQFEKEIQHFSEGQKKKVLLAKSLCEQAHLYIWDEPLNFIDILSRIQIEELILKCNPTLLFVEHDLSFTQTIATKHVIL